MTVKRPTIASLDTQSAVVRAAEALRRICIMSADDEFIGSEETLATRLGISAPTLRQAGRILEFEQLLRIKRGLNGGYFVRLPSMDVAVTAAGTWLAAHQVPLAQSREIGAAILDLVAREAAGCEDQELQTELARYRSSSMLPIEQEWEREQAFLDLLARMSGNDVARLLLRMFNYRGGTTVDPQRRISRELASEFIELRAELAGAVINGDVEPALALMRRRLELIRQMIDQ